MISNNAHASGHQSIKKNTTIIIKSADRCIKTSTVSVAFRSSQEWELPLSIYFGNTCGTQFKSLPSEKLFYHFESTKNDLKYEDILILVFFLWDTVD